MAIKYVYLFANGKADGRGDMKDLLGGKGAGLAEMTNASLPVPPGFTITTEACNAYYGVGAKFPEGMWDQVLESMRQVERASGKTFGDPSNPLLGQAEREVLERQLEFSRLAEGLRRMAATPVLVRQTHKPSPFAFPIMVSRFREKLTNEKLADRVRRMQLEYDKAAPADPEEQGQLFG